MPSYEYDKDYPFAAFITNLGKYNEGELVGEWVKFPTTADELKKVFERIGIGQEDDFGNPYEEWFITDYDCYVDGLYDKLGEYANLDELNYLASKLDDMTQSEYEQFQAAVEMGEHTGSIQDLINLTENLDYYDVYPDIESYEDLGWYYIEELGAMQVPEYLQTTSTTRHTAGMLPWRKAVSLRIRAMSVIAGAGSMKNMTETGKTSLRNTVLCRRLWKDWNRRN